MSDVNSVVGRRGLEPRSADGGVGRTRTSTDLRPKQVGYRLPNDPVSWYDRPGSNRDQEGHNLPCCRLHHSRIEYASDKSGSR